jgi:hypothetical protein
MTNIDSSAQPAPGTNVDSAPSAPQPALNCTSPAVSGPRVSWVYLCGVLLLVLSVLVPFCLWLVRFMLKEPYSVQSWPFALTLFLMVFQMYGTLLLNLAGPLCNVMWYLVSLLILWRVISMLWARSLSPPSGYSGFARKAVLGAAGLMFFGWVGAIVLSRVLARYVDIDFIQVWFSSTGLFPLAICWVEVKSAYDSFKAWRAGRVEFNAAA